MAEAEVQKDNGDANQPENSPELESAAPRRRFDRLRQAASSSADRVASGFSRLNSRAPKDSLREEGHELAVLQQRLNQAENDASDAFGSWDTHADDGESLVGKVDEPVEINYDYAGTGRVETKVDIDRGEIKSGNVGTAVELVTQTAFSDSALWRGRTRGSSNSFGLDIDIDAEDISRAIVRDPQALWLANIYGFRTLPDTEGEQSNAVRVEEVDYDTLSKMHEAFAGTVLTGEHTRIAVPTDSLYPEEGLRNPLNNNYWLEKIRDGYWPIMKDHKDPETGELVYNEHDSSAIHLGNMALLPREAQDIITEAAVHELAWREKHQAGEVADKIMFLPGEDKYDDDPFASGFRGSQDHDDGIMKIDNITDDPAYLALLTHVVADKSMSCADRMKVLQEKADGGNDGRDYYAVAAIGKMSRQLGDLVNFNSRHRDGKNTTPEEVKLQTDAFLTGVVRVAEKIRGYYPEDVLDHSEKKEITTEEIREDALNRLKRPQAERKGTEIVDQVTGEMRKPCFEVTIDADAQVEVAEVLRVRSEGLAKAHSLLDKLPPMEAGKVKLEPLPLVDSLDQYVDKAQSVYEQWLASNKAPVFGPPSEAHEENAVKPHEVNGIWDEAHEASPTNIDISAENNFAKAIKTNQDFTAWRDVLAQGLQGNQELVLSGQWPGAEACRELKQQIENIALKRTIRGEDSDPPQLMRDVIAGKLGGIVGSEQSTLANSIRSSEKEFSKKIKSDILTVSKEVALANGGGVGYAKSLGLTGFAYEQEGEYRNGVLADAYLSAEDVATYELLGQRLDAMFGEAGETAPSEAEELTPDQLANRLIDFRQQLIPKGASLIHATRSTRIEDILEGNVLLPRGETGKVGDLDGAQGKWSNFVHFAEPGKFNAFYGDVLIAVPIESVIAETPYHQGELKYKGGINTQEKYGAIEVGNTDLPLAVRERIDGLNNRFSNGLLAEGDIGTHNNLSFAATPDAATAATYGYDLADAKIICSQDTYNGSSLSTYGLDHPGWQNEHVVMADGQTNDKMHGLNRSAFEKPVQFTNGKLTVYGPLSQRRVEFSEHSLAETITR